MLRIILYTGLGNLSWCFNMFQSWKHYFSSCGYPQTKKLIQSIGSDYETCFQIHCPSREGYMFGIIVVVKTYITTNMIIVTQVARRVLRGRLPVLDEAVQKKFPNRIVGVPWKHFRILCCCRSTALLSGINQYQCGMRTICLMFNIFHRGETQYAYCYFFTSVGNALTHWAETKWPPFSRRHFQVHFLEWKCMNFD